MGDGAIVVTCSTHRRWKYVATPSRCRSLEIMAGLPERTPSRFTSQCKPPFWSCTGTSSKVAAILNQYCQATAMPAGSNRRTGVVVFPAFTKPLKTYVHTCSSAVNPSTVRSYVRSVLNRAYVSYEF